MRAVWSLFPKAFREYSVPQLAELVRSVGLDTTNVVIRKGFPVEETTIAESLPRFQQEAANEGLKVTCASTMLTPDEIASDHGPLPVMAACGIREFRMGWFPKAETDIRSALQAAKGDMDRVAAAAAKHRIKAIYQIHHNTLITSASAAYNLVRGLPPQWIGVELDPGNQSYQGFEPWHYGAGLLDDYCSWLAVKDTVTWQENAQIGEPDKGWRRRFEPVMAGVTNWHRVLDALNAIGFDGTIVFMPFYEEQDDVRRTKKLADEVAYLRAISDSQTSF